MNGETMRAAVSSRRRVLACLGAFSFALGASAIRFAAAADIATGAAAWRELASPGAVAVIRHARTSGGVGDPTGFRLDDCATQRNLSDQGRAQAAELGGRFRANLVTAGLVLSSRWCRCQDTARLAFGKAEPWPALDNVFDDRAREPAQNAEIRRRIRAWTGPGALVLVSHGVNITPLTGLYPAEGEAIVLRPDPATDFRVVGRIAPGE